MSYELTAGVPVMPPHVMERMSSGTKSFLFGALAVGVVAWAMQQQGGGSGNLTPGGGWDTGGQSQGDGGGSGQPGDDKNAVNPYPSYPCDEVIKDAAKMKKLQKKVATETRKAYRGVAEAAVVVGCGDDIVAAAGYGQVYGGGTPKPDKTTFDIKSVTKPTTAVTLLMLEDDGKINLSDPAGKYVKEYSKAYIDEHHPGKKGYKNKPKVTVEQLLNHTAGLPEDSLSYNRLIGSTRTAKQLQHRILDLPLVSKPGAKDAYSNASSITALIIGEEAAGEPIEDYQKRELFTPAGMKNTAHGSEENNCAERYCGTADRIAARLGGVAGHAGLRTTAVDYGKFVGIIAGDGSFNNHRFMAPGSRDRMLTPSPGTTYGLSVRTNQQGYFGDSRSKRTGGHYGDAGSEWSFDPESGAWTVTFTDRPWRRGLTDYPTKGAHMRINRAVDKALG